MFIQLLQYYDRNNSGNKWLIILLLLLLGLLIITVLRKQKPITEVLSHWHHRFESSLFTPEEFYTHLKTVMVEREISKLNIVPIVYPQAGWLSPNRKYLRIQYSTLVFDVCAAPFAKEFFVSWWYGEVTSLSDDFFTNIPFIGKYFSSKKRSKTFFELDFETMFKETVSICVRETIDQLTLAKGMRKLAEGDWKEFNS